METKNQTNEKQELISCFECGKKINRVDGYIWYHGDQDDLICTGCAMKTKHTDTAYAGTSVMNRGNN